MRAKITQRSVKQMPAPASGQAWMHDSQMPGFLVLAQASGRKTFVVKYKAPSGRTRKATIGSCAELTADEAREIARNMLADARAGKDPAASTRRGAPTMADLAERFMREHAAKLKPKTREQYAGLFRLYIVPAMGDMLVAGIRRADVQRLHSDLADMPHTANRALAVVRKALNVAEVWGWRDENTNPTLHVKAYPEHHRQRTLDDDEVRRLWSVLDDYQQTQGVPMAQLVKLLLLTGCRLNEMAGARWAWIDADRQLLRLPDTKTGARDVVLAPAALAVLDTLPRDGEYVLPGTTGKPMQGIQKAWQRIRTLAGIDDVRLHDLRHTVGSLGHRAGLTQRQIADLLGHRQMATTARYINSSADHRRETADRWGGVLSDLTA